jgi:hypothetical protein
MTQEKLQSCSKKDLAELARKKGVPGWHAMRKEQLLKALTKGESTNHQGSRSRKPAPVRASANGGPEHKRNNGSHSPAPSTPALSHPPALTSPSPTSPGRGKDLARTSPKELPTAYGRDRIVLMVRDPYWLHAYWEITRSAVERAEAALGQEWHSARPILRLYDVTSDDTTSSATTHVHDIDVHGDANNWYIDVSAPPRSFRVDIGYLARSGRFIALARSNVATTPRAGVSDVIDENWVSVQEQFEKIYAMSGGFDRSASSLELQELFEERLRRPLGSGGLASFGSGPLKDRKKKFHFQMEAELVIYGSTLPNAQITLQGEPVKLRPDGTFTIRVALPDSRQIIPATAVSSDGNEQRTIVLAVERNTRELEPLVLDRTAAE